MKGLRLLGDVIFEYLIITLILILSICLVIPFIPVFVGVIAYLRLLFLNRLRIYVVV